MTRIELPDLRKIRPPSPSESLPELPQLETPPAPESPSEGLPISSAPMELPTLESLPEVLPTESKIVIGMRGWTTENIPKGESKYCHFPTGQEDARYTGGRAWERVKVTALDDIRANSEVFVVDDKRNVLEQTLTAMIKESQILNNSDNIKNTRTEESSVFETAGFNKVTGILYANQNLTVYVDQSMDSKNWDASTRAKQYTASSTTGAFSVEIVAPYVRVRIVNSSGADTTICRKFIQLSAGF